MELSVKSARNADLHYSVATVASVTVTWQCLARYSLIGSLYHTSQPWEAVDSILSQLLLTVRLLISVYLFADWDLPQTLKELVDISKSSPSSGLLQQQ